MLGKLWQQNEIYAFVVSSKISQNWLYFFPNETSFTQTACENYHNNPTVATFLRNFPLFSTENWNSSIIAEELKWLPASKKVSSLKPFVRFYPLWNVFWAVPSKGISDRQVTLSQCHHISWGKQNNPKREPKEASLIIWLPSRTFPLLNSSKGQSLHGTVVFQHKLQHKLSFKSPPLAFLCCSVCIQESGRDKFPTHVVANTGWFFAPLLKVAAT